MEQNTAPTTPASQQGGVEQLHKTQTRPFIELIISNRNGGVLNTITSENPELAKLINKLAETAETNGFPISKGEPIMPLGQDIFYVGRELVLSLIGGLYSKTWKEIQEMPKNFPETAHYTFVVSY